MPIRNSKTERNTTTDRNVNTRIFQSRGRLLGWCLSGLTFLVLIGLTEMFFLKEREAERHEQKQDMSRTLAELAGAFSYELNSALYFSLGLRTYIEASKGAIDQKQLSSWLTELQVRGKHIRNIGLAPGNRITYIYPLKGNEAAIGLYYPNEPTQWPGVKEVIETRKPKLIGPFNLKQGGQGLVYREAIFLATGDYWGVVSTVIDADSLFSTLLTKGKEANIQLNIRDLESNQLLIQTEKSKVDLEAKIALNLPGRQWELLGEAEAQPINARWNYMRLLGWAVAFSLTFLLVRYLKSIEESKVTQRLLSESQTRLKRAFSASSQGMALVNQQGQWLEVNQSMLALLMMNPEQLATMPISHVFAPEERQRVEQIMEEISQHNDENIHYQQFEAMLGSGCMGLVSLGVCYKTRQETHWIVQIIDISERIRLDKLKREFVSVVSHELRTPLTSISAGVKLLASGKLGNFEPAADKIIHIALHNADRLSLLINDLLDMEKLVAGKMTVENVPQNIVEIAESALESVENFAAQQKIHLVRYFSNSNLMVRGDALRLTQVIVNLLSNAIKFSPAEADVELSVRLEGDSVRVAIRDHGPGIALENQNKLFKQFSQIDTSDTRKQSGTGLGLAISKELIELMGGTIGIESESGFGATFYFTLPCLPG